MKKSRRRILYYCQSLVGIGHLTASLQIIHELTRYFDVDLIYGGINYNNFPVNQGFRVLQLPALLFNEAGELYPAEKNFTLDEAWQLRQRQIEQFAHDPYHAIIFEFYPFGRRRFKKEIHRLIQHIRECSGEIPLFSQIREILIPSDLKTEQKIMADIDANFHSVLVRGDPNIIRLDETFSLTPKLGDRLFYAGYISSTTPLTVSARQQQILVSQGGGNVGQQLLIAAIQAAPLLPVYSILVATGSDASTKDIDYLHSLVTSSNVKIVPFLSDFRQHLLTSALSINMGGDNTLLDVISTKTPSLAYPYPGNIEQTLRISKLAEQGWLIQLNDNDLKPEALAHKIKSALTSPYPNREINLNGAINICNKIREVISGIPA